MCRPESTCPPEWSEANEPDPSDEEIWQALYSLAPDFVRFARRYGVKLVVLQPLNQFDGWLAGTERAEWVRRKAQRWLPLCSKLGVEFLQVCFHELATLSLAPLREWTNDGLQVGSNDWVQACANDDKTAEDMRWIAELGAKQDPPVKIAYEPWCFSNLRGEWEECYKTIQQAVRLQSTGIYKMRIDKKVTNTVKPSLVEPPQSRPLPRHRPTGTRQILRLGPLHWPRLGPHLLRSHDQPSRLSSPRKDLLPRTLRRA